MIDRSTGARLLVLSGVALAVVGGASFASFHPLSWRDVALPADGEFSIYWNLRLPRTLLAALVGAGLSVGGVFFQTLFRNPLASPYTLGVDTGAALGAAIGFVWRVQGSLLGLPRLTLLALAGASAATAAIFVLARSQGYRDLTRLLLAGVCISYLSSAGVLLFTILAGRAVSNDIVIWLMGSLEVFDPGAAIQVGVGLLLALAYGLLIHRDLDLLATSEQIAATRGVSVDGVVRTSLALVTLLTALIVAHCGPIGFVGLIVPHLTRMLLGSRAIVQLLGAALVGAAFLAACDALARSVTIYSLPVGVVTNILGAVFFFWLLAGRDVRIARA